MSCGAAHVFASLSWHPDISQIPLYFIATFGLPGFFFRFFSFTPHEVLVSALAWENSTKVSRFLICITVTPFHKGAASRLLFSRQSSCRSKRPSVALFICGMDMCHGDLISCASVHTSYYNASAPHTSQVPTCDVILLPTSSAIKHVSHNDSVSIHMLFKTVLHRYTNTTTNMLPSVIICIHFGPLIKPLQCDSFSNT